jgi:hypothetical protein
MDWQVTAYTTECSGIAEEVTITITSDWAVRCTGFEKFGKTRDDSIALLKRSLDMKQTLECKGLKCKQITEYLEKLQSEEPLQSGPDGAAR